MTNYYQARPCDINAYRDQTEKGYSSGGFNLNRRCHVCGSKGAQGYKKVKGTGGSRHSPTLWRCPSCDQRAEQTTHQAA